MASLGTYINAWIKGVPATTKSPTPVVVVPAQTDNMARFNAPRVRPQMITTSVSRSGTVSGLQTDSVGTIAADGWLTAVSGSMVEFGATMNAKADARIEVTDGAGTLKFAVKMTVGAQGGSDSIAVCPQNLPVSVGDQVNIVSNVNQTTPAATNIYAYVCVTPLV